MRRSNDEVYYGAPEHMEIGSIEDLPVSEPEDSTDRGPSHMSALEREKAEVERADLERLLAKEYHKKHHRYY